MPVRILRTEKARHKKKSPSAASYIIIHFAQAGFYASKVRPFVYLRSCRHLVRYRRHVLCCRFTTIKGPAEDGMMRRWRRALSLARTSQSPQNSQRVPRQQRRRGLWPSSLLKMRRPWGMSLVCHQEAHHNQTRGVGTASGSAVTYAAPPTETNRARSCRGRGDVGFAINMSAI